MEPFALQIYNSWGRYRNPNHIDATPLEAFHDWRTRDYQAPPQPAINPQRASFIEALPDSQGQPPTVEEQDFLTRHIDGLPLDDPVQPKWQGRKFLGHGSNAAVALFDYIGGEPYPENTQIAVKVAFDPNLNMEEEGFIMNQLTSVMRSPHIVNLYSATNYEQPFVHTSQSVEKENLHRDWIWGCNKLLMEYCSLGTLDDLLIRRIQSQHSFQESTLWRIFDCFADALCMMEHGQEFTLDSQHRLSAVGPVLMQPIIHFDIKPENILLSPQNLQHAVTPVCKVGDFGLAYQIEPNLHPITRENKYESEEFRYRGTPTYFSPEQFTERWDYQDYQSTANPNHRVAGAYGPKTNVWGIGGVMAQLVMLQYAPVSHQYPFTPSWTLKNAPAKGVTYCQNLHAYNVDSSGTYSRALTDLIYECLYEIPYFRPSSRELKVRIAQAFQALLATNPAVEPWSDFIPPAPGSNVVTPTAQPTTTGPAPLVPIVQPDMTDGADNGVICIKTIIGILKAAETKSFQRMA